VCSTAQSKAPRANCKHVAAALLCWIDKQSAKPSADDQALRAVNRWLQKLVEQGKKSSSRQEHHEPGEPLLFYQLDSNALTQSKSGITLEILQSRLLKRGGYGKETPYRYHGPAFRLYLQNANHRWRHWPLDHGQIAQHQPVLLGQPQRNPAANG